MEVSLPYGRHEAIGFLPENWKVEEIFPNKAKPIFSPEKMLNGFLDRPVNCKPFDKIFSGKKSVAVVVPDKTRKSGVKALLPVVLSRLEKLGVHENDVKIVFATGIHPGQTEEQKRAIVGDVIYKRIECVDHDPRGELEKAGEIDGIPLMLNASVARADGLIVIGGVKLHYLAGFGGGRKAIMPGVASREDCVNFHGLCMDPAGKGRYSNSKTGVLKGNPMHERALAAARAADVDFMVNTVVNASERILFVNAGDVEKSFLDACEFARGYQTVPVTGRADVVIASCGGYPADINFIQAHKSLDSAYHALKPGGVLFLVAECAEGIGNDEFLEWFDYAFPDEMEGALRKKFVISGHTAYATREKTRNCRVVMLTELESEDVKRMGMSPVSSFGEGLKLCVELCADLAGKGEIKTYLIREAGVLYPDAD